MPGRSRRSRSPGGVQHDLLSQTATCRVDLVADQVDVPLKAASAGGFWGGTWTTWIFGIEVWGRISIDVFILL